MVVMTVSRIFAMLNSVVFLFGKDIDTILVLQADCLTPRI